MNHFGAAIFGCSGLKLTPDERDFFRDYNPFGFILFARNIADADQLPALVNDLRSCVSHHAPVLIDQEGGRVQRLRPPMATDWLPPLDHIAKTGDLAERAMYLRARITAHELTAYGIDSNCAPLVDVAVAETHPFLKNRCYGDDPFAVSQLGRAVAQGHLDGGVLPVLKHIPGHGRAVMDSHLELPRVSASAQELQRDFRPFHALNDLSMAMTAHIVYEAYDDQPATTSIRMIDIIRGDIGFGGLLMTDDISMQALSGSVAQRSRASIQAGCDVILHCNGTWSEMQEVARAAGQTSLAAQARAEAVLNSRPTADNVDIDALRAELEDL